MRTLNLWPLAPLVFCATLATTRPADAHNGYALIGAGAGIKMVESLTQFKLHQELGVHLSRKRGGLNLALAFGESFGDDVVGFQVGLKVIYDIHLGGGRTAHAYLGPFVQPGYGLFAPSGGSAEHHMNLVFGADLKLLIGRLLLFVRPFALDMYFVNTTRLRYDVAAGVGITF